MSRTSSPNPTLPTDRFRIFRQRLLILLSTSVVLIGIALIIISQFTKGAWHEALVGIGAAIFATGPITVMVWWVTDDLYRGELSTALQKIVSTAVVTISQEVKESRAVTQNYLREANSIARNCQDLGVVHIHLTRVDALNRFSSYIREEIERAKQGNQALLWFVCTDLRGFLDIATNKFNPQALIRAAAAQPTLDLRILMADPEYTIARSENGGNSAELRQRAYDLIARLQREYGVKASAIRLYAFRPTVFAIATSRHMLLNPYPHQEQASHCMSLVVKAIETETDGNSRAIYSQYRQSHFERTWDADTTREIDKPPPLVSRISLSRDYTETNALLSKEVADHPPGAADMIEFSGDTVRSLLEQLAQAGTRVRLLLKHPDSVGNEQRDKIISTYRYLKEHLFMVRPDSFQVRFYRLPASVRGRRLDMRLINVGWYTPDVSTEGQISDWEIVGHLNPTVTGDLQTTDGKALNQMFSRTFDGLWRSAVDSAEVDRYLQGRADRDQASERIANPSDQAE